MSRLSIVRLVRRTDATGRDVGGARRALRAVGVAKRAVMASETSSHRSRWTLPPARTTGAALKWRWARRTLPRARSTIRSISRRASRQGFDPARPASTQVSDGEHYAHRSVALLDFGAVEYNQGLALKRVSDDTKVWHQEARRRYELDWKTLLTEHFVGRCSDSRDEDLMEAEGSQATSAAAARVAPTRAAALERRWLAASVVSVERLRVGSRMDREE